METIISISDVDSKLFDGDFAELFSSENLTEIAKAAKQFKRERKFRIDIFVYSTLKLFNESPKEQNVTLANLKRSYDSLVGKEEQLAQKPFYLQLAKEETFKTAYNLLLAVLSFTLNKSSKKVMKHMKPIKRLCEKAMVSDIIMVDGCEIVIDDDAQNEFMALGCDVRGSGRKHKDGSNPSPALKLHVAFSLTRQTFVHIDITGVCDSERKHIPFEKFHNVLFIMDRGYPSVDIEQAINDSGNFFLIRDKKNRAGRISMLFKATSSCSCKQRVFKYDGKAVSKVKYDEFDADAEFNNSEGEAVTVRICKCKIRDPKTNRDVFSYFRTNLKRHIFSLQQIGMLYRTRWLIEILNKLHKSFNGLSTVNSSKPYIILTFILFSLIAALVKTIMAHFAQGKAKLEYISMMKCHMMIDKFSELFIAFAKGSMRAIQRIINEIIEYMMTFCRRTVPSKRNKELEKDLPTLIENILAKKNPWEIKNAA